MTPDERPAPDLDHTRAALRAHDERVAGEDQDEVPETPPADEGGDEAPESRPADDGEDEQP